jgi:hypothetical protein
MSLEREIPDVLRIRDARGQIAEFRRAPDLIAVHASPEDMPGGAMLLLEDGSIGVFASSPTHPGASPVYHAASQTSAATIAVPTGRVLLRYGADTAVTERAADIKRAGYLIEEQLAYAPNAAWVRAADGSITSALRDLDALESLPGVENVEPQMIRAATRR